MATNKKKMEYDLITGEWVKFRRCRARYHDYGSSYWQPQHNHAIPPKKRIQKKKKRAAATNREANEISFWPRHRNHDTSPSNKRKQTKTLPAVTFREAIVIHCSDSESDCEDC